MCKTPLSALFMSAMLVGGASPALAVDSGTVTFNGKIIEDTCNVTVNGDATNGTVNFSDLHPSVFSIDNSVGESQSFDIALKDCDKNVDNMNIKFKGTTISGKSEEVLQPSGDATHVGIRLKDWTGAAVKFDDSEPVTASNKAIKDTGAATFTYTADVVQVGDVLPTAGDYTAQATYTLLYR
ncbi:TPA: fimbrial protein [Citrobacter gillenii]